MNKKVIIISAIILAALISIGLVLRSTGYVGANRINMPELTLFSTSTNANYAGLTVANVNDFDYIAYTVVGDSASGTVKFLCSFQDTEITTGTTSTTNRWDYVDATYTQTEASIDGNTGVTLTGSGVVGQYVVRNSAFKWCSAMLSGNTTPAGYGTTTVYMKRANNL